MKKIISILLVLITIVSTEVLANNVDNNIQSSNYSNVENIISDIEFDDIYCICIYRNINNYTEVIEISNREDIVCFLNQFQKLVVFQDNISSDSNIRVDFWMKKSTPHTKNIYNVKHGFKKKNEWTNQFISESELEDIIRDMDIEWRVNNSGASPVNQEMVYPVKIKPESEMFYRDIDTACAAAPEVQENTNAVTASNIEDGDFVIAAVYNKSGVLEGVKIYKDQSEVTVNYSKDIFANYENADYMKLFVWSVNQEPKMTAYGIDIKKYKDLGEETDDKTINIQIGDNTITATLEDNSSAQAFYELLKNGSVTVDMHDYGNFEKVGSLGTSLPRNDEQITTEPGDII